jgi:P-type E1-E2 ATPase
VKIGNEAFVSPDTPLNKKEGMVSFLKIGEALYDFRFSDALRSEVQEVLESLKSRGLEITMLTGDHLESAQQTAQKLGIDKVYADLRPEHKLEMISKLSKENHLAMVGDGINDAPALTRASVGISMGEIGSATAVDASDIVLLQDDLRLINWLHIKAKKTMAIVKQNLSLALGVIVLATTPALLGVIPLWLAVILHEGGTVLVGLNSLRLLRK